ncbi:MAG: hypothetical protein AB1704_38040 [Pseudomonadota bacterium]|jgi:hypothetical protein|uniref:hypothetical protein n=1 Tax=Burkholderiaceae TaxID=119060 RepID=UPI0010F5289B|nr:hypothetical protein [Burkholderia sp. 4M9327F10]
MIIPYNLDDEARNELLTYLVVSQLVGRARSGEWLKLEHLIESESLWLKANGGNCNVVERLRLHKESLLVASNMLVFPVMKDPAYLSNLFTDGWRLDYRNPVVRGIFDVCASHLLGPLDVRRDSGHRQ